MDKPSWLVRGAKVVIYADYPPRVIVVTTVKEIGQRFFTTAAELSGRGQSGKFTIKTLTDSSTHTYSVLPVGSVSAQKIIRQSSYRQTVEDAATAVWRWECDKKNRELRDAAVVALQAIEYEE